jgi:hypothetical protein
MMQKPEPPTGTEVECQDCPCGMFRPGSTSADRWRQYQQEMMAWALSFA